MVYQKAVNIGVSTHSRLKAAGTPFPQLTHQFPVSTHSRLKAAGRKAALLLRSNRVSTHSRLKAAGPFICK